MKTKEEQTTEINSIEQFINLLSTDSNIVRWINDSINKMYRLFKIRDIEGGAVFIMDYLYEHLNFRFNADQEIIIKYLAYKHGHLYKHLVCTDPNEIQSIQIHRAFEHRSRLTDPYFHFYELDFTKTNYDLVYNDIRKYYEMLCNPYKNVSNNILRNKIESLSGWLHIEFNGYDEFKEANRGHYKNYSLLSNVVLGILRNHTKLRDEKKAENQLTVSNN